MSEIFRTASLAAIIFLFTSILSLSHAQSIFCQFENDEELPYKDLSIDVHYESRNLPTKINFAQFTLSKGNYVFLDLFDQNSLLHTISGNCDDGELIFFDDSKYDIISTKNSIKIYKKNLGFYYSEIRKLPTTEQTVSFNEKIDINVDSSLNLTFINRANFLAKILKSGVSEKRLANSIDVSHIENEFAARKYLNKVLDEIPDWKPENSSRVQIGPVPFEIRNFDFDRSELNVAYATSFSEITNPHNFKGVIANLNLVIGHSGNVARRIGGERIKNRTGYNFGGHLHRGQYYYDEVGIFVEDLSLAENLVKYREDGIKMNAFSECDIEKTPGRSTFQLICISKKMTVLGEDGEVIFEIHAEKDERVSFGPYGGWKNQIVLPER